MSFSMSRALIPRHTQVLLPNLQKYSPKSDKYNDLLPTKPRPRPRALAFQKPQAGPKANSNQRSGPAWLFLAWLGLAFGFRPELANYYHPSNTGWVNSPMQL